MHCALIKSQDNVIDCGDIATSDFTIAILVSINYSAVVHVKDEVVECGNITTSAFSIAVHVAGNRCALAYNNPFATYVFAVLIGHSM